MVVAIVVEVVVVLSGSGRSLCVLDVDLLGRNSVLLLLLLLLLLLKSERVESSNRIAASA